MDPWLFGIARRVAADHHRQANRRRTAASSIATPPGAGPAELVETPTSTPPSAPSSISSRPVIGSCSSCASSRGCRRTTSPRSSASDRAPYARRSRGRWVACAPGWPAVREVDRERRRAVVPTSGCARARSDRAAAGGGAHRHAPGARRGDVPRPSRADATTSPATVLDRRRRVRRRSGHPRPARHDDVVLASGAEAAHDVGLPVDSPDLVDARARRDELTAAVERRDLVQPQPRWLACEWPSPGSTMTSWPRSSRVSTSSSSAPRRCSPHHRRPRTTTRRPRPPSRHQRADRRRGAATARRRRSPRRRPPASRRPFRRPRPTITAGLAVAGRRAVRVRTTRPVVAAVAPTTAQAHREARAATTAARGTTTAASAVAARAPAVTLAPAATAEARAAAVGAVSATAVTWAGAGVARAAAVTRPPSGGSGTAERDSGNATGDDGVGHGG